MPQPPQPDSAAMAASHPHTQGSRVGQEVWRILLALTVYGVKQFFGCRHHKARMAEGKVVCVDCGASLVREWVVLRCQCCDAIRPPVYWYDAVVPGDRHCHQCGAQEFRQEPVDLMEHPHLLQWAILTREPEAVYLQKKPVSSFKKVWLKTQQQTGLVPISIKQGTHE